MPGPSTSPGVRTVSKSDKFLPSWSLCVDGSIINKYVLCHILIMTSDRNRAGYGEGTEWSMSVLFYTGWSGEASLNKTRL